jgi:hypothetical protein
MVDLLGDDDLLDLGERAKATDPAGVVREMRKHKDMHAHNSDLEEFKASAEAADTCQLCKEAPPKLTCHNCRKQVCKKCSWTMLGLCQTCATEERVSKFNVDQTPEGNNWLD